MAELRPFPFSGLVTRMLEEFRLRRSIFDLPERRWFRGDPERGFDVVFHGDRAGTPLGPAAGPQSQMAQNLVLSWLGGCRIMELKTVQVDDRLAIPRPCIDMQTVGYNVEWSQELRLPESLDEYVKGAMLIEILRRTEGVGVAPECADTIYDMSVGYDVAGIRSDTVQGFIRGMRDCTGTVDRLRSELGTRHAALRELPYPRSLSHTLTLSTFHGCPPGEIEGIVTFLMQELGLDVIVKLNPMLLGPDRARELLCDVMGYTDLGIPDSAFTRDTTWPQMVDFVGRLGDLADDLGTGFGVKFTNTLIVENHRSFFPDSEREMYLSGPPLHVLAMELVRRFRRTFGDRFPISFSAGVDRANYADSVALGIVPVTVCSDLLKPGGYARAQGYHAELAKRMDAVGATDVLGWVRKAYGAGAATDEEARLANTETYVERLLQDPRYHAAANTKVPRKIGSTLELFDCITCDKCVPVCPNAANFTFTLPDDAVVRSALQRDGTGWVLRDDGVLPTMEKHQIGNLADFCNECGNCDVFCPEDGGPYVLKPRFFRTFDDWCELKTHDGFHLTTAGDAYVLYGRIDRREYRYDSRDGVFHGDGFRVAADDSVLDADPGCDAIDLTPRGILRTVLGGVLADATSWIVVGAETTS